MHGYQIVAKFLAKYKFCNGFCFGEVVGLQRIAKSKIAKHRTLISIIIILYVYMYNIIRLVSVVAKLKNSLNE